MGKPTGITNDHILAVVRQRAPISGANIGHALGVPSRAIWDRLLRMRKAGVIERNGRGDFLLGGQARADGKKRLPVVQGHMVPWMTSRDTLGEGQRLDCARVDACREAHAAAYTAAARCPAACRWYERGHREPLRAVDFARSGEEAA